jgi:endonuclease V-like protein UPF0215 family
MGQCTLTLLLTEMNATDKIAEMITAFPHHRQLRAVMPSGITFGGFNIADIKRLNAFTNLPIIALTHDKPDLQSIHDALEHVSQTEERWRMVIEAVKSTK